MKFGPRKPNLKKSLKARTTGKAKRKIKKSLIPGYGKKGTGIFKDPKKAVYNKVYNKTTFRLVPSIFDVTRPSKKKQTTRKKSNDPTVTDYAFDAEDHLIDDGDFSIFNLDVEKVMVLKENRRAYKRQQEAHKKSLPFWKKIFYSDAPKLTNEEKEIYKEVMLIYRNQVSTLVDELENLEDPGEQILTYYESLSTLYKFMKVYENSGNVINYEGPKPMDVLENLVLDKQDYFQAVIQEYYEKERASALELKTDWGQENRMKRKYEDLMVYAEYLSPENIERIQELWKDYIN